MYDDVFRERSKKVITMHDELRRSEFIEKRIKDDCVDILGKADGVWNNRNTCHC